MLHPSVGAHSDEAFPAVHSRSRPAFPSPAAPGSNRLRSGFPLELRTPPLPAAHVEVGTDPEHCPGYVIDVTAELQSMRHLTHATSCRPPARCLCWQRRSNP